MTDGFEAAGDVVTGAVIGRTVEPDAGQGATPVDGRCLNCGATLTGAYCCVCGQNAHVHRTMTALGHDIGHGVFHFEGKVWRTLPMLVRRPGELTRRYIAGERARFVSPMALFLFSVFLMFAVIHNVPGDIEGTANPVTVNANTVAMLNADVVRVETKLAEARAQQERQPTAALTRQIEALQKAQTTVKATRDAFGGTAGADDFTLKNVKTGWARLDRGVAKATENPGLMIYKLQTSAYKYSWALIPISVPFVALLFLWRRKFNLYDHAIFVTYSLAFMMLLVVVLTIAGAIGIPDGFIVVTALTVPIVHMFTQLRGAYELGKPSALWRTVALTLFAFIALAAFTMLLLGMGLMD